MEMVWELGVEEKEIGNLREGIEKMMKKIENEWEREIESLQEEEA